MFNLYKEEGPLGEIFTDLHKWTSFHYEKQSVPIALTLEMNGSEQYLVADIGGQCSFDVRESRDNGEDLYGIYIHAERPQGGYFEGHGLGAYVSTHYFILDLCDAAISGWNWVYEEGVKAPRELFPAEYKELLAGAKRLVKAFKQTNDPIDSLKRDKLKKSLKMYKA